MRELRSMLVVGAAAVAAMMPAPPGVAQAAAKSEDTYVLVLAPSAATMDGRASAEQLVKTYGGEIISGSMTDESYVVRVSGARARMLAADARVASLIAGRNVAAAAVWSPGLEYTYDGSGNITAIGSDTFAYDKYGRLHRATVEATTQTFGYDAYGNRISCNQGGSPCQPTATISAENNQVSALGYDLAGNVTAAAGHAYAYDAFNMQVSDTYGNNQREYVYTADDERIAAYTTGSWWQWSIRDLSGKVVREFTSRNASNGELGTASWAWSKDYIWRDGQLLATRQPSLTGSGNSTFHYHLDHLGTPRLITTDAGYVIGAHNYHPFGPEAAGAIDEAPLTAMKFTGHERDNSQLDGLDYMHARYYSAQWGRFMSADPLLSSAKLSLPQSWNRYSYCWNEPVNLTDPTGQEVYLRGATAADRKAELAALKHSLHADAAASQLAVVKVGDKYKVVIMGSAQEFSGANAATATLGAAITTSASISFGLGSTAATRNNGGAYTAQLRSSSGDLTANSSITIDPARVPSMVGGVPQTLDTVVQHEFGHALGLAQHSSAELASRGPMNSMNPWGGTALEAIGAENRARMWYQQKASQQFGPASTAARAAERVYAHRSRH